MADQRNWTRLAVAISSLIVAVCAVVLTIEVGTSISVKPQRVLDQTALEQQVADEVRDSEPRENTRVSCPLSVVVEVDSKFECRVWVGTIGKTVRVTITSDQGTISISEA
jgi:hypothetical protein